MRTPGFEAATQRLHIRILIGHPRDMEVQMATLQLVDLADGLRMLPTTSQRKRKASPMAIGAARKHYVHLQASRDQWSQRRDDQTP